jgi:hypothetical protein
MRIRTKNKSSKTKACNVALPSDHGSGCSALETPFQIVVIIYCSMRRSNGNRRFEGTVHR